MHLFQLVFYDKSKRIENRGSIQFITGLSAFERFHFSSMRRLSSRTHRKLMPVKLYARKKPKILFSLKKVVQMKLEADLSDRQLLGVLKSMKRAFGKSSPRRGIEPALQNLKHTFEDLFAVKKVKLETFCGITTPHFVVYCLDIFEFVNRITMSHRMTSDEVQIKFGIDYGQSFLKVTMTLKDVSNLYGKRKSFLTDGKKTVLLAICQAPGTFSNLKALFTLLKAPHDLECSNASDLEVISITSGLNSRPGEHLCPYCTSKSTQWDAKAPLRMVQLDSEHYRLWKTNPRNRQYYNDSLSPPSVNSTQPILVVCPPHALHIQLRIVNLLIHHLFSLHPHLENEVTTTLGIVRKDCHGKFFDERQCSKLIAKCDALAAITPPESQPIINCLRLFGDVFDATFDFYIPPNYREIIDQFGASYSALMSTFDIPMTPDVHIILHHIPHFIHTTRMPLGPFSRQVEGQHQRFVWYYNRYVVTCTDNLNYPNKFLNSVLLYNAALI